jgi:hypothetical protein
VDGSGWCGASLGTHLKLGARRGYRLVHCTYSNAFFVAAEDIGNHAVDDPEVIYRRQWGGFAHATQSDSLDRVWQDVSVDRDGPWLASPLTAARRRLAWLWARGRGVA